MNKIPQRPQDGLFINSDYIALNKKDQQVPIRPNLFKVQVYNLTFGAYLVEPIVFWLLQSLEKFVVKLRKILVLGHLLKNMLNLFHYKIIFRKNLSLGKLTCGKSRR